jgi:hypothetical protein
MFWENWRGAAVIPTQSTRAYAEEIPQTAFKGAFGILPFLRRVRGDLSLDLKCVSPSYPTPLITFIAEG